MICIKPRWGHDWYGWQQTHLTFGSEIVPVQQNICKECGKVKTKRIKP